MDVYRAAVTFFNSNGRDGLSFVFCLLLFCAVLLVTVLFLFQKQFIYSINSTKESLCDFYILVMLVKLINA